MDRRDHWFHVSAFARLGPYLLEKGVAPAELFRRCSVPPITFADPNGRLPRDLALRLINEASQITGDPVAAMRVVELQQWLDYGAAGAAIPHAPTLADAIAAFAQVTHLTQSGTRISLDTTLGVARVSIMSVGAIAEDPAQHLLSGVLWLHRVARLAEQRHPLEVRLGLARPPHSDGYEGFLGPNLVFGSDRYEIVFDLDLLGLPLAAYGAPRFTSPVDWRAADRLDGPQLVHHIVAESLPYTRPTVDRVAANLGASTRSLQRILGRWGVTFEDIVDRTRQGRALDLLAQPSHSMIEIAGLLGYSDQAHFSRAFRRWTGVSPRAYQKRRTESLERAS